MSHETFKQSDHSVHGNAPVRLRGGKLTKDPSCALKPVTASLLRLCLSVHWAAFSHTLSAS